MGMELVAATQPGFSKAAEGILGAPWRCTHYAAPGARGVPRGTDDFSPSLLFLLTTTFRCQEQAQTTDWRSTLQANRKGVHKIDKCLSAVLDLLGGEDWLCQCKCSAGSKPFPRCDEKPSPPKGCGSSLFGVHLNIGIPSLTKCCKQRDRGYGTCGKSKKDCDEEYQCCPSKIC
eukprot:bmy_04818T0